MESASPGVFRMILVPSLITLGVTVLRLIGELRNWPDPFFRKSAGGFGSIVGIAWLALIFAIYFAIKLQNAGKSFERPGRAIGFTFLSIILCIAGMALIFHDETNPKPLMQFAGVIVGLGSITVMRFAWPAYWNVMLAYALAARIPVIIIMYLAMQGNWGTHYDVAPPGSSYADWQTKFIQIGLLPQLLLWIPYTISLCGLFGIVTVALRRRRLGSDHDKLLQTSKIA